MKTKVDPEDGYINIKKLEPMLNTVTPDLTCLLRCNTDVTSLLSGTSIKAVVAYVSDYITKSSLKIYHMFDSVNSVLKRQTVELGGAPNHKNNYRKMLMQMVNSLTSKLQIGSPMASLYLLKNPDHYTNYKFKPFWWKSYVGAVRNGWDADERPVYPDQALSGEGDVDAETELDQMVLMKAKDGFVGTTNVDDYVWRPAAFENTSLYEYIQMTTRVKRTPKQLSEFLESLEHNKETTSVEPVPQMHDDWLENDLGTGMQEDLLDITAGDVSSHSFHKTIPCGNHITSDVNGGTCKPWYQTLPAALCPGWTKATEIIVVALC
jgi:hypothetical protein